jgi:hypothetical protein
MHADPATRNVQQIHYVGIPPQTLRNARKTLTMLPYENDISLQLISSLINTWLARRPNGFNAAARPGSHLRLHNAYVGRSMLRALGAWLIYMFYQCSPYIEYIYPSICSSYYSSIIFPSLSYQSCHISVLVHKDGSRRLCRGTR